MFLLLRLEISKWIQNRPKSDPENVKNQSSKSSINILIKSTEKLLKRFNEQKGIIDAYIKKEREWKKHKLVQANEIKKLEKANTKLAKVIKSHEQ